MYFHSATPPYTKINQYKLFRTVIQKLKYFFLTSTIKKSINIICEFTQKGIMNMEYIAGIVLVTLLKGILQSSTLHFSLLLLALVWSYFSYAFCLAWARKWSGPQAGEISWRWVLGMLQRDKVRKEWDRERERERGIKSGSAELKGSGLQNWYKLF